MPLLVVDGLNIIRRIYEAIPEPDSEEKMADTLQSSVASLRRALLELRPTHAVMAIDFGGLTWRHALYPAYKANRKPMPQFLKLGLPQLIEAVKDMGLPCVMIEGVEADDVIATLIQLWTSRSVKDKAFILSTDKDLCQLITLDVVVRDHFKNEWRDEAWVQTKFGVAPAQLGDFLALTGDSSDGIPGIEGVGPKRAAIWLGMYQTLENVLANSRFLRGKVGQNLRRDTEIARLSRQLISFKTDITLGLTWKSLEQRLP